MEVYYRREMRRNYLVIKPDQSEHNGYESRMLADNRIDGLLKFRVSQPEGETCFYYEITSKQPLSRILEGRGIGLQELRSLIMGIAGVLAQIEIYLLPEEQILLEPEYIYVEPETFRISLCLVPGVSQDFPAAVEQLLQYLLGSVDHQDKECVVLAYGLYQECQKENFGMEDLLRQIHSTGGDEPDDRDSSSGHNIIPIMGAGTDKKSPKEKQRGNQNKRGKPDEKSKRTESGGWRQRLSNTVGQFSGLSGKTDGKVEAGWDSWEEILETPDPVLPEKEPERELMTVLLTDLEAGTGEYCLRALQPGLADIPIKHFPFIIGKNSSLADYHLEREAVSRLHVKIDRNKDRFEVTDLNSTNGTKVRGQLLENNESVALQPGDELHIAKWRYCFQSTGGGDS